jgi:CHAD domain-containing protein
LMEKAQDSFSKIFAKSTKTLEKRTNALLQSSTVDAVHDIRTAIRRVEAAIELLPKKSQKKQKFRRYLTKSKKLFKATSPVRDADIIVSSLREVESAPGVGIAISRLQSERDQRAFEISDRAETFSNIKIPKPKKNQVTQAQLKKRKTKVSFDLQSKIAELIPVILRDFRKIDDLHDLRKYCKNLRYALEILPSAEDETLARLMEDWQKTLGNVRDIYMTQHFIEENKLSTELEEFVSSLNSKRERLLESFIHSAQSHVNGSSLCIAPVKAIAT